jgi:hypothetical protein
MAENKTKETTVDPHDFIKQIDNEEKRKDFEELMRLMAKVTGKPPRMWGPTIVGFGKYRYKYESGREGEICLTGFSPRKPSLVPLSRTGVGRREADVPAWETQNRKGVASTSRDWLMWIAPC